MQPAYQITINSEDISARLADRLISLTLSDKRGLEADQLDLTISDHDGQVNLPKRGVAIRCYLGWMDTPLVDKGSFIVDEVEHSGSPDKLIIRARSADFRAGFKQQKERSWHEKTLAEIVKTIAVEHTLKPIVTESLQDIVIPHLDQTNESDANLLARLANLHDAIVTVKNGSLLMLPMGHSKTVSGLHLPTITLTRADGDSHRYAAADRQGRYTGTKAHWNDTTNANQESVIIGAAGYLQTLRKTYANPAEAKAAATAQWQRLQRGQQSMELTLAAGRADIIPESPIRLSGWKTPISTTNWLMTEIKHTINDAGFTSQLLLETATTV